MRMLAAQHTRERVMDVLAATPMEHAMRSEQPQYTVQSIGISANFLGKMHSRLWFLIECVCESEISRNVQGSRQPLIRGSADAPSTALLADGKTLYLCAQSRLYRI